MSILQFIVALATALVAPVALYAQQRLQIRREDRRWMIETRQRRADAEQAASIARLTEQRGVYQALLQAAYAFRAERSV